MKLLPITVSTVGRGRSGRGVLPSASLPDSGLGTCSGAQEKGARSLAATTVVGAASQLSTGPTCINLAVASRQPWRWESEMKSAAVCPGG
jgi:hypothetical protein